MLQHFSDKTPLVKWVQTILASSALLLFTAAVPVQPQVRLSVMYNDAADLFSLMDNVSGWLDGFTDPAYRSEWVQRFGWSAADQAWVVRYREYRLRTFVDDSQGLDPATSPDGIFAARSSNTAVSDPLAAFFMSQTNIRTALAGLDRSIAPKDAKMLRGFYAHFTPKWRVLLAESKPLVAKAAELDRTFDADRVTTFVARMSRFYGVAVDGRFTVFFTRFPPGKRSSAEVVAGEYVLLHSPPGADADMGWDMIVMHELAHYISARQSSQQKKALTARFFGRCQAPSAVRRLWLLEEPLAVAWGQATYSAKVRDRPLDPKDNWYAIPWIDIVSRTIAPSLSAAYETNATIMDGIADEAADRCKDLTAIASMTNAATK